MVFIWSILNQSNIINDCSCLKCCIFTKLSQIVCVIIITRKIFCMYVCLSPVVIFTAYTSLYRGLAYQLKTPYFVRNHPNEPVFNYFYEQVGNTALYLNIISQKCTAFVFGNKYLHQTFTECEFNQYTYFDVLIYQM